MFLYAMTPDTGRENSNREKDGMMIKDSEVNIVQVGRGYILPVCDLWGLKHGDQC